MSKSFLHRVKVKVEVNEKSIKNEMTEAGKYNGSNEETLKGRQGKKVHNTS